MQKTTTWKPDTCSCVLHYSWDSDVPTEQRIHTIVWAKCCDDHKNIPLSELLDVINAENFSKNIALQNVLENTPSENKKKVDDGEGNLIDDFIEHPKWRFNKDRELIIELPKSRKDFSTKQKQLIKDAIKTLRHKKITIK